MTPLLRSKRTEREAETDGEATTRGPTLRSAVLGIGALAGGYVVGRRLSDAAVGGGSLRERAGDALPGDGVDVPIVGGGGETAPPADPSLEEVDERTRDTAEGEPADLSPEEMDERATEAVGEEPAEPGEMQVDEDLVDEAVDSDEAAEE